MSNNKHNLAGQQFGWLTALRRSGSERSKALWLCRCICGFNKQIAASELVAGQVKSCGCMRRNIRKNHGMGMAILIGEAVNEGVISVEQADRRRIRGRAGPEWPERYREKRGKSPRKAQSVRQGDLRQKEKHQG